MIELGNRYMLSVDDGNYKSYCAITFTANNKFKIETTSSNINWVLKVQIISGILK